MLSVINTEALFKPAKTAKSAKPVQIRFDTALYTESNE